MKMAIILLLMASCSTALCAALDTNVTAIGYWSEPVRNQHAELRGRIVMVDAFVYLDLQEDSGAAGACLEIEWNPVSSVRFEVTNGSGQSVPTVRGAYSGPALPHEWLKLPPDSTMRLRASPYNGGGRAKDGSLNIMSPDLATWSLKPSTTNDYFLSVTLAIGPSVSTVPTNRVHLGKEQFAHFLNTWQGTLRMPKVKISMVQDKELQQGALPPAPQAGPSEGAR